MKHRTQASVLYSKRQSLGAGGAFLLLLCGVHDPFI